MSPPPAEGEYLEVGFDGYEDNFSHHGAESDEEASGEAEAQGNSWPDPFDAGTEVSATSSRARSQLGEQAMEQVMDHDQTNRQRPEPLASVSVLGSSLQDSLVLTLATESSTADMMLSQLISPLAGGPDTLDAGGLGLPAPFRSPASPSSVAMGPEAVQVLEAAVDAAGSDCFCWTGTEDEHLVTTLSMADKVESPEPWEPLLTSTLTGIIDGALVSRRTVEDLDRAADSLVVSSASGRGSADGRDIQEAVTVEGMSSSRKEEELEKEKRGNLLPLPPEGVERARSSREQRRDSRTEEEAALAAAMMAEPEATQGSLSSPEELATTLIITVEEEGPCHLGKRPVSSEPPAAAPGSAADTADAADAAANAAGAADAGTSEPPASAAGAADAADSQSISDAKDDELKKAIVKELQAKALQTLLAGMELGSFEAACQDIKQEGPCQLGELPVSSDPAAAAPASAADTADAADAAAADAAGTSEPPASAAGAADAAEGPCQLGELPVSSEPPAAAPGSAADTADAADAAADAAGAADAGTSEPPASAAGAADAELPVSSEPPAAAPVSAA
ncbi:unnamed protein product, partial [Polarella glacialis]